MKSKNMSDDSKKIIKKKQIVITVSIISVIVLTLVIFCSVFFCVKFDLNDKIEDFFAQSDIVTYSHTNYEKTYQLPSSTAKEIILKYFKDKKFKNNNDFHMYANHPLVMYCGDKEITIHSYFFNFVGKFVKSYNPVPRFDFIDELYNDLDSVSIIIEESND